LTIKIENPGANRPQLRYSAFNTEARTEVDRVDRGLVERAQGGDRDAYEALARQVAPRLYAVAFRVVRDPDRADDAVQQALISIWRELKGLRDPDRFQAWTYRLVIRACHADSRKPRRLGVTLTPLPDELHGGQDAFLAIDARDELDRAFSALSHEHRVVLVLRHFVGLSNQEIADVIGVPYGTVASRLHHASDALRASLDAGRRLPALRGQHA
jgi:RNA polymerase sigma-70 factor (ECF subfamily)